MTGAATGPRPPEVPGRQLCVALAQMCSTTTHAGNIAATRDLVAASGEAQLVALPEVSGLMNRDAAGLKAAVSTPDQDPFIAACRELAREHGKWIHIGSTPVTGRDRLRNHSALIDPEGRIAAEYDKIHLFDAWLDGKRPIGESKRFEPGDMAVLIDTPWGGWGMSICYDLRYPRLYRQYGLRSATVIFVPSAFTVPTGKAHWEVLLRARAIETGAWVIAAAQAGHHDDGRHTHGHSMIVNPWGQVTLVFDATSTGVRLAWLDLDQCDAARARIPALQNEREFGFQHVTGPAGTRD